MTKWEINIPLAILGPLGSTKTLAFSIVTNNMKGRRANLFPYTSFHNVHVFRYFNHVLFCTYTYFLLFLFSLSQIWIWWAFNRYRIRANLLESKRFSTKFCSFKISGWRAPRCSTSELQYPSRDCYKGITYKKKTIKENRYLTTLITKKYGVIQFFGFFYIFMFYFFRFY